MDLHRPGSVVTYETRSDELITTTVQGSRPPTAMPCNTVVQYYHDYKPDQSNVLMKWIKKVVFKAEAKAHYKRLLLL